MLVAAAALSGCVQPVRHPAASPAATTVVVPGCPPVVVTPVRRATRRLHATSSCTTASPTARALIGRRHSHRAQLGPEVFRVSLHRTRVSNELTQSGAAGGHRALGRLHPGPVTGVTSSRDWSAACRLAAQHDGRWYVYLATVDTRDASRVKECALDLRSVDAGPRVRDTTGPGVPRRCPSRVSQRPHRRRNGSATEATPRVFSGGTTGSRDERVGPWHRALPRLLSASGSTSTATRSRTTTGAWSTTSRPSSTGVGP